MLTTNEWMLSNRQLCHIQVYTRMCITTSSTYRNVMLDLVGCSRGNVQLYITLLLLLLSSNWPLTEDFIQLETPVELVNTPLGSPSPSECRLNPWTWLLSPGLFCTITVIQTYMYLICVCVHWNVYVECTMYNITMVLSQTRRQMSAPYLYCH